MEDNKLINLNVGGIYFTTTLATLKSEPDSMLAAMFSGKFSLIKDEKDAYFIDRNGRIFERILDWLRSGTISPFLSQEDIFWLQEEAKYFQLVNLQNQLKSSSNTESKRYIIVQDYHSWKDPRQKKIYDHPTCPSTVYPPPEDWIKECILPYLQKGYTMTTVHFGRDDKRTILAPSEQYQ